MVFYILSMFIVTLLEMIQPSNFVFSLYPFEPFPCTDINWYLIIDFTGYHLSPFTLSIFIFMCILNRIDIYFCECIQIFCYSHHFIVLFWSQDIYVTIEDHSLNFLHKFLGCFMINGYITILICYLVILSIITVILHILNQCSFIYIFIEHICIINYI